MGGKPVGQPGDNSTVDTRNSTVYNRSQVRWRRILIDPLDLAGVRCSAALKREAASSRATWRGHELHVFNRDKAGGEGHRHATETPDGVARLVRQAG